MKAGGFDAVVGNPPYILLQDEFRDDQQLEYFRQSYEGACYKLWQRSMDSSPVARAKWTRSG
jgi:tRNA1(Val) A37 N6-methylase TrmN6